MNKTCLFIDDADISAQLEQIQTKARRDGLSVTCILMIAASDFYNAVQDLDLNKIRTTLFDRYFRNRIDLIACDYNLGDDNVSGLDIIQMVREKYKKQPIILYSSNLETVLRKEIEGAGNTNALVKKLKRIINWKIERFVDRDECVNEVIELLRDVNFDREVVNQLLVHKNLTLQHGYTKFKGKTLENIAQEIDEGTSNGLKFLQELVERSVANMIELNKQ